MKLVIGKVVAVCSLASIRQIIGLQLQQPDIPSMIFGYYNHDNPPPRVGTSAPIDPAKASVTIQHLQKFVAASSEGYASILTMGDSTMSGIIADLKTVNTEVREFMKILHTSNDRPENVRFTSDNSVVKPGGEWFEHNIGDDPRAKLVRERSRAATKALHSRNCSWSGGVESYLFDGGPLNGFAVHAWSFIPEYGETCWRECFQEAVKEFKASAVLWNVGFHLLNHKFDHLTCAKRQNMGKENCGDYKELVHMGTRNLLDVVPLVIWRTTNYLCESRQRVHIPDQLVAEFDKWQDPAQRSSLEDECHENCNLLDGFVCYDWLMAPRTTERLHSEGLLAINQLKQDLPNRASQVRVLDTFTSTKECCDRGCEKETEDGEHYRGLDRGFVDSLAAMLVQSA